MKFNARVESILIESGWDPSRDIDSRLIIDLFVNNGHKYVMPAVNFLKSTLGIKVNFINLKNGNIDDLGFDLGRALELETTERLELEYMPRLGKKVCVIGTAYREHFILLMDENGAVYGGYDDYLVKIANSGEEAITAIIDDKEFIEIP